QRDLRLVLVGDGPERRALQAAATDLGQRVVFPGFTDRPWEVHPAFDLFVMPSQNEGLPLALLDAMSCGVPPIAMAAPGVGEVIGDGNFGWLVESGDTRAFLASMEDAAKVEASQLAEMGEQCRQRIV